MALAPLPGTTEESPRSTPSGLLPQPRRHHGTAGETEAYSARGPWAAAALVPLRVSPAPRDRHPSPFCGEQLQETLAPAGPPAFSPLPPARLPEDARQPRGPGKPGSQLREPRASTSCFPTRPGAAGCSQWARGASGPQPIRRQQAARVKAGPRPQPRPARTLGDLRGV